MSTRDWKRAYRQALHEQAAPDGNAPAAADEGPPHGREQRRHPRLHPRGVTVEVGVAAGVHLLALDERTVEFYAERRFTPGTALLLQVDTAPPLQTEVEDCRLEPQDTVWLEARYHVRCRVLPHAGPLPAVE